MKVYLLKDKIKLCNELKFECPIERGIIRVIAQYLPFDIIIWYIEKIPTLLEYDQVVM